MLFLPYRAVFFRHENGVAVFDLAFFRLAQGFGAGADFQQNGGLVCFDDEVGIAVSGGGREGDDAFGQNAFEVHDDQVF